MKRLCSHRSGGAAKRHASAGRGSSSSSPASFRRSELYTRCPVTASTPEPEGGARCVSSARRDLCGGRGEILVPTATVNLFTVALGSARLLVAICHPHGRRQQAG
jgi:hypothetical protein